MAALIELGTEPPPFIRGKHIGTCYFEAAYNELTSNIILTLSSMLDDRVRQEEYELEEAIARWEATTGEPLYTTYY